MRPSINGLTKRPRTALQQTATEFGVPLGTDDTGLALRVDGGGRELQLGYIAANYFFSRVYDLTVQVRGAWGDKVHPTDVELHFARDGMSFRPTAPSPGPAASATARLLNRAHSGRLSTSGDIQTMHIEDTGDGNFLVEIVPVAGAYVWLVLPPLTYRVRLAEGHQAGLRNLLFDVADTLSGNTR